MAKKKGRPRKEEGVERYANGRIKVTKDTIAPTLVRRMLDDEMKRCSDPRFGSQLGRLVLRGEILAAEYQAGLKFAEIYERTARNNELKRTAKSPDWQVGSCGAIEKRIGTQVHDTAEQTLSDPTTYEVRTMAADKAYRNLCETIPMGQRFGIAEQTSNGIKVNAPLLQRLKEEMLRKQIDVVTLDPLIKFHSVPESDNVAMDLVMVALSEVANDLDISVDLLHHPRKPSPGSGHFTIDDGRGASAVISAVRIPRVVNSMSSAEAAKAGIPEADRWRYFNVKTESNLSAQSGAEWYRLATVFLPCGESIGVAEAWKFPDAFRGVRSADLEVAQNLAQGGAYRASSQSPQWFGWAFTRHRKKNVSVGADRLDATKREQTGGNVVKIG